jgi:hypothetical protein
LAFSQNAGVYGIIKNNENQLLEDVNVTYQIKGTKSDSNGFYNLEIPANQDIEIIFSHLTHQIAKKKINLKIGEKLKLDIILQTTTENIPEVIIESKKDHAEGITNIKVETIKNLPSANQGVEGVIKNIALGTSSDNELSTQYKVRGGNYDENLVYVNGIEIYRPFLVRSGQQEGLSFVNPEMTSNVKFSSGGFQAIYGDKLSSVLDITYRKPIAYGIKTELSLLGASLTLEGLNKKGKTSAILGMRYRDNSLFVKSQDVETNYNPRFADIQTLISHQFNDKWNLNFLGNFAFNDYHYIPTARRTKFGTLEEPLELVVFYNGQEEDNYLTSFGAINFQYIPNPIDLNWRFDFTTSVFNTQEKEYFDIEALYNLGNPNTDAGTDEYGETELVEELGVQIDHARNAIDALISNMELKGQWKKDKNVLLFGIKYQQENIKDRLIEWQVIDSAGFSLRPPGHDPNLQPYVPYEGPIVPYQYIRNSNQTDISRITGFIQWNKKFIWNKNELQFNVGLRNHLWILEDFTGIIWSPRAQIALKPNWKKDIIFRLSGGNYAQPPMYKEVRNIFGEVVSDVKAQQSYHIVTGTDFSFKMWKRPFHLTTEIYYKHLEDVNPYTLDNVRIRYAADNNAVAYSYGLDFRINGEFVPGTESWFNFGYLQTEENIENKGYIARPSDQRLKFALLFQDYVPSMPNLKMYMNMIYNTGVPGGSPTYADPYDYNDFRLGDYKRVDLGVSFILKDAQNKSRSQWLTQIKEFSVGAEIFNLFDMQNAITNTWVKDIYSKKMYGVKNYMTGRVFNVKMRINL